MKNCVTVTIAKTDGSAPRGAGAYMTLWPDRQTGSIGGGALEWEATQIARDMLSGKVAPKAGPMQRVFPLGPGLGQCCGGSVVLEFTFGEKQLPPDKPDLWIWGAGHVGRAIVKVLAPFADRQIVWVDVAAERFPGDIEHGVQPMVAEDPLRVVAHAGPHAGHLIVTYSHDLDLKLCDAVLRQGFTFAGLIGSRTKWKRFQARLQALGHSPAQIARIACPIGERALGKHPQAIAIGVAHRILTSPMGERVRVIEEERA